MKTACSIQCKACPFRRNSLPGWLGDYTPESIFYQLWRSIPFFCHTKIDYADTNWHKKADKNGKLCLGSVAFQKKIMAPLHKDAYDETDGEVIKARKLNQDRKDIDCMEIKEFMSWHKNENGASMKSFIKNKKL